MTSQRELAYLTPITPAQTGNGLAMRSFLFLAAASCDFAVKVLVVPVAGWAAGPASGSATVLALPGRHQVLAEIPGLLASPTWRGRITGAYPMPVRARLAPATLAAGAISALGVAAGTPVHVARSYLAPLGIAIAEQLGSPWASLDLDDDDEQLARALGDHGEADAYRRLIGVFGPLFQAVALAAPGEAAAISHGHGFATTVIPNAVRLPGDDELRQRTGWPGREHPEGISVLFAGNLTYPPNAGAAVTLVREVLPRLRRLVDRPVTVTVAGEPGQDDQVRSLAAVPGVQVTGFVADLAACYRAADVVVAPLAAGGGTRIKLLEAMAYGLPVVTSTAGAAGLGLADGVHALIADSPAGTAGAVAALAASRGLRERLVAAAGCLVSRSYSHDAVIPQIRKFFASAGQGGPISGGL